MTLITSPTFPPEILCNIIECFGVDILVKGDHRLYRKFLFTNKQFSAITRKLFRNRFALIWATLSDRSDGFYETKYIYANPCYPLTLTRLWTHLDRINITEEVGVRLLADAERKHLIKWTHEDFVFTWDGNVLIAKSYWKSDEVNAHMLRKVLLLRDFRIFGKHSTVVTETYEFGRRVYRFNFQNLYENASNFVLYKGEKDDYSSLDLSNVVRGTEMYSNLD